MRVAQAVESGFTRAAVVRSEATPSGEVPKLHLRFRLENMTHHEVEVLNEDGEVVGSLSQTVAKVEMVAEYAKSDRVAELRITTLAEYADVEALH